MFITYYAFRLKSLHKFTTLESNYQIKIIFLKTRLARNRMNKLKLCIGFGQQTFFDQVKFVKREDKLTVNTHVKPIFYGQNESIIQLHLQWYNQKQIKRVLSCFLLGNLSIYLQFSNLKSERDRIKYSWQITCDDQIMLTHIAEASFITVSIYCMRAHLFHYRKLVYKTDRLNCMKSNKTLFVSLNLVKQPLSHFHHNSKHITS